MALERGKLTNVVQVAAGSTVGMITCANSKKVYIKSIICHQPGGNISTGTAQVYFVPNGDTFSLQNKIFDLDIKSGETILLEPSYPIVLDTTGDSLRIGTGNHVGSGATYVNFLITGDQES